MKPLVYKGLRKNLNRSEWVSSDEIKQSYSQIRLLSVENDNMHGYQLRTEHYVEEAKQKTR